MKKLTLSILISAFTLSEAQIGNTVSAQKLSNVFLYAGQSNADGRVYNSELPSYLSHGYEYLHFTNVTSSSDGKFGNRTFENKKERILLRSFFYSTRTWVGYSTKIAVSGTCGKRLFSPRT